MRLNVLLAALNRYGIGIYKLFIVLSIACFTQVAVAGAISTNKLVEITVSPQVQAQLRNASPQKKKKLIAAIRVSNILMRQFLDHTIVQDDDGWQQRTGKLLAMSGQEFMGMLRSWREDMPVVTTLVCSNVLLSELKEDEKGEVQIAYQSRRIGNLIPAGINPDVPYSETYSPEGKGFDHHFQLNISANAKLLSAIPQENLIPNSYMVDRGGLMTSSFRKPLYVGEPNVLIRQRIASYDQAIKEMDQAASEVCISMPVTESVKGE